MGGIIMLVGGLLVVGGTLFPWVNLLEPSWRTIPSRRTRRRSSIAGVCHALLGRPVHDAASALPARSRSWLAERRSSRSSCSLSVLFDVQARFDQAHRPYGGPAVGVLVLTPRRLRGCRRRDAGRTARRPPATGARPMRSSRRRSRSGRAAGCAQQLPGRSCDHLRHRRHPDPLPGHHLVQPPEVEPAASGEQPLQRAPELPGPVRRTERVPRTRSTTRSS